MIKKSLYYADTFGFGFGLSLTKRSLELKEFILRPLLFRQVNTKRGTYVVTDLVKEKGKGKVHPRTGHNSP